MKQSAARFFGILLILILGASCGPNPVTEPVTDTPAAVTPPNQVGETQSPPTLGSTLVNTQVVPIQACNIEWSRLRVGMDAYITYGDRANRVRSKPVKDSANVIGYLYPGTVARVIEGPVCADNLVYWRVEHASIPGGSGWTPEGNGIKKRWLNPSNCASGQTALYKFQSAYVVQGIKGLRVYDKQGSNGTVIAYLDMDAKLKVIGGPYCTDNTSERIVFWNVENGTIPGGAGWVAEYGYEDNKYVRYLSHDPNSEPTAFPIPATLASVTPEPGTGSSFMLSDLAGLGQIAYIAEDWVWMVNADGTNPHELRNPLGRFDTPRWLSWSLDGQNIVTTLAKKMFVLSTNGQRAFEPLQAAATYGAPVFSPDGQFVAYAEDGFGDIYVVGVDGSNPHKVNNSSRECASPVWSPFGRYVAYICYGDGSHLYISDHINGATTTLSAMGQSLAWSPDGEWIAFSDNEEGFSVMKSDGSSSHLLLGEPLDFFAWSPDSKSIAFVYGDQIYILTVADAKVRNITGHTLKVPFDWVQGNVSWSPDGEYVGYGFQSFLIDEGYWRISPVNITKVSTGARQQVLEKGALPAWSPTRTSPIVKLPDCTSGWSRLTAGEPAKVMGGPSDPPNRVRSGPGTGEKIIFQIFPGAILDLLEGPVCANGLVFWKVANTAIPGGMGWTAEGDGSAYWLEPYQP